MNAEWNTFIGHLGARAWKKCSIMRKRCAAKRGEANSWKIEFPTPGGRRNTVCLVVINVSIRIFPGDKHIHDVAVPCRREVAVLIDSIGWGFDGNKSWPTLADKNFHIRSIQLNFNPPTAFYCSHFLHLKGGEITASLALLPLAQTPMRAECELLFHRRSFFLTALQTKRLSLATSSRFFALHQTQEPIVIAMQSIIKLAWPSTDNESRRRDGARS